jgi:uncharacterized protein YbjT (DUF2867 family)
MDVVVFGAAGGTGRQVVDQALVAGHTVTAFVRHAASMESADSALQVRTGDVRDADAVEKAVTGQDAAIFVVGAAARAKTDVRTAGTRNVVRAMERAGGGRLIAQSTIGIGDSASALPPSYRYVLVPLLLRRAFADHLSQEQVLRDSTVEWTAVRASVLTDGPRSDAYRHGLVPGDASDVGKISRADVAAFLLRQLTDDTYRRRVVHVSG